MYLISIPIILIFLSFTISSSGVNSQSSIIFPPKISFCLTRSTSRNCSGWGEFKNSSSRFGAAIGNYEFLHLNCKAPYPIRWLAGKSVRSIELLSNYSKTGPHSPQLQYEQKIIISWEHPEELFDIVYRCESYRNSSLLAEVYLIESGTTPRFAIPKFSSKEFFMVDGNKYRMRNQTVIIPCFIGDAVLNNAKLNHTNSTNSNFDKWSLLRRRHGNFVQTYLPESKNYDPRIGFSIPVDDYILESTFECIFKSSRESQILVPLSSEWQVPTKLEFVGKKSTKIDCDLDIQMDEINFKWRNCSTILECDLLWKPMSPIIFRFPTLKHSPVSDEKGNGAQSNQLTRIQNHGYVQCSGFNNNSKPPKFVNEFDYVFKGLDNKYYFAADFPVPSVIQMVDTTNTPMKSFVSHNLECTISTFLLAPYVEFVVKFNSAIPSVTVTPGSSPMGANMTQLLPNIENATMSWRLEFYPTPDITSVVCRSPWLNSNDWAESVFGTTLHELDNFTSWKWVAGVSAGILVIIALTFGVIVMTRKYQSARELIGNLSAEEVNEFHYGNKTKLLGEDGIIQVESLGFDPEMRITNSGLTINNSVILGEGQYGIVHPGKLEDLGEVAVKSCKSSADIAYFRAFLNEVKVMAFIGEHRNIVKFFGAVVDKIQERECLAVIELSPFGNLNQYLRSYYCRRNAKAMTEETSNSYINGPGGSLSQSTLISFCEQIALAMEYLSDRKVIHGDLATRNVLVFSNNLVKITDFGLSRKLYSCQYVKSNEYNILLPWRWMALESLRYFQFSIQSDVWSFGVTVWEIFSQAAVPYSGVDWAPDFLDELEAGRRLSKPQLSPPLVFDWMMKCWLNHPKDRPTFSKSTEFLKKLEAFLATQGDNYIKVG